LFDCAIYGTNYPWQCTAEEKMKIPTARFWTLAAFCFLLVVPQMTPRPGFAAGRACIVYLADGSVIRGELIQQSADQIEVRNDAGTFDIKMSNIAKLEFPPESLPAGAPPTPAAGAAWGGFSFTAGQTQALQSYGCRFDPDDEAVARRLSSRGFTAEQYVNAYREWSAVSPARKGDLEAVAVFQALNLPMSDFAVYQAFRANYGWLGWRHRGYLITGGPLTDFYNARYIGGRELESTGVDLTVTGAVFVAMGAVIYEIGASDVSQGKKEANPARKAALAGARTETTIGGWWLGLGSAAVAAGIPCWVVGGVRTARWAPPGTLENGSAPALRQYQIGAGPSSAAETIAGVPTSPAARPKDPALAIGFAPYVGRKTQGFGLSLRF
jgi:hypothetical protein